MKIVNDLARQGLLQTTRGRGGGLRLLKAAADIRIGDVVRASETDFRLVECFDASHNACTLTSNCQLQQVFGTALQRFFSELDKITLADVTAPMPPSLRPGSHTVSLVPVSEITRPTTTKLPVKKKPAVKTSIQSKAARSTSSTRA
jgi:Rrf2 family nitric oxide-sensitive transcriptional repressor